MLCTLLVLEEDTEFSTEFVLQAGWSELRIPRDALDGDSVVEEAFEERVRNVCLDCSGLEECESFSGEAELLQFSSEEFLDVASHRSG